jgi:hypothetical protein
MVEEKAEVEPGRVRHLLVRGGEALAVVSLVLVPVIRKVRARQHRKHVHARRHFPILGR